MPVTPVLDTEVDLHDLIALTDTAKTARGKGKGFFCLLGVTMSLRTFIPVRNLASPEQIKQAMCWDRKTSEMHVGGHFTCRWHQNFYKTARKKLREWFSFPSHCGGPHSWTSRFWITALKIRLLYESLYPLSLLWPAPDDAVVWAHDQLRLWRILAVVKPT